MPMADARSRAAELATAGGRSLGPVQPGTSRYAAAVQVTYELR